jgi:L-lactate dehydrogenase complex protein LldE
MLKIHYPRLLENDPRWRRRAEEFAPRCHELLSFLHDVRALQGINTECNAVATYHDSCSDLRELGVKDQPRQLLSQVRGLELKEMRETEVCCGFGGTFCVKYPEISTRMASDKVANLEATDATLLLGGDLGCLLNLAGRMRRLGSPARVFHAAEILAGFCDLPSIGEPFQGDLRELLPAKPPADRRGG